MRPMSASPADEIASAAARLVVDEGMEYAQAKRKAARPLGRAPRAAPSCRATNRSRTRCAATSSCSAPTRQPGRTARAARAGAALDAAAGRVPPAPERRGLARHRHAAVGGAHRLVLRRPQGRPRSRSSTWASTTTPPGDDDLHYLSVAERCPALGEPVTLHLAVRDLDDQRGALKPDAPRPQLARRPAGAAAACWTPSAA